MNNYKLIYHDTESSNGGISPFDKAIHEKIVKKKNISIVCPYIGIDYFKKITDKANSWRFVTDIGELLYSKKQKAKRQETKDFILNNSSKIHHCKDIHAKVIVSEDKAFIGSSNFTDKGITKRVEMAILIENKDQVEELQKWFDDLWKNSESVKFSDVERYLTSIESLLLENINKPKPSFTSNAIPIRSKYIEDNNQDIITSNQESYDHLVESIRKLDSNREWINDYFNLANEIIEFTKLKRDDPRLVTSITINNKIPITINQRYILRPESNDRIGLIMSLEYNKENEHKRDGVVKIDDDYFFRNKEREAYWIVFERKKTIEFSEKIKDYWKRAVKTELDRGKKSGFGEHHKPIVYDAIMNLSFRSKLLDDVFSETL